ncbi:MAG: RsmE family RNA methyltransferase [Eubacteriales bacterium]|nr:RsmE family RNA methyltransferase [Eubacteriales bacterium]
MPKFFIADLLELGERLELQSDLDLNHLLRVRRVSVGENLRVVDGSGKNFLCQILTADPTALKLGLEVIEEVPTEDLQKIEVSLFQAMPKGSKFDLCLQLAGSFGVDHVYPLETHRTIKKAKPERLDKQLGRWQKILEAQSKQSGKSRIAQIHEPVEIKHAIDMTSWCKHRIVANFSNDSISLKDYLTSLCLAAEAAAEIIPLVFFIGPEGGFTEHEAKLFKANGIQAVDLGSRVLRSEYAATQILAALTYEGLI